MLSTNIILYPEFNHCILLPHHLTFIQATIICCFGLWLQPPSCWSCYTLVHPLPKSWDDTLKISHILLVILSNLPVFSILGVKNQLLQVCSGPEQSHSHLWIHLYPLFLLLSQLQPYCHQPHSSQICQVCSCEFAVPSAWNAGPTNIYMVYSIFCSNATLSGRHSQTLQITPLLSS